MWNEIGIFSYVIPFLLIFAVVFAILDKTKLLSGKGDDENKAIIAIIAVSIALLSLQFDFVSVFFATIFPRFGIGISVFLVFIIFVGFFLPDRKDGKDVPGGVIGWIVGIGVIIWAFSSWGQWTSGSGVGGWFAEYIWAIIILGVIIGLIIWVSKGKKKE